MKIEKSSKTTWETLIWNMPLYQLLKKRKVQKLLLNVAVEPTANTSIMKFKATDVGLDNTKRITKKQCNEAFSTRIRGSG